MTSPDHIGFRIRPKGSKFYLQWKAFIKATRMNFLTVSLVKQNIVFPFERVDSYSLRAEENCRYYLICCLLIFGGERIPLLESTTVNFPPRGKVTYKLWYNISRGLWTPSLTPNKTQG